MAIGLKYGKALMIAEEKKQLTYFKTPGNYFEEFIKIHGSTNCRELLDGLNMSDPEDHNKIMERNLLR